MTGAAYFPSNGTEGDDFEAKWCAHCLVNKGDDWEDEFGFDVPFVCPILSAARCGSSSPQQWVYRHDMPWCTAFEEDATNPPRCLFTMELPLA